MSGLMSIEDRPAIRLYSVYDRLAGKFSDPFPSVNDATAIRQFKNTLSRNPFDYGDDLDLMFLAAVDLTTGEVHTTDNNKPIFLYRSAGEVDSDE